MGPSGARPYWAPAVPVTSRSRQHVKLDAAVLGAACFGRAIDERLACAQTARHDALESDAVLSQEVHDVVGALRGQRLVELGTSICAAVALDPDAQLRMSAQRGQHLLERCTVARADRRRLE